MGGNASGSVLTTKKEGLLLASRELLAAGNFAGRGLASFIQTPHRLAELTEKLRQVPES
jgi:hypothetical protein